MGKLNFATGNIVRDELLNNHDLIVNPTNPRMVCGAGVSGEIFHAAGVDKLENYTQSTYNITYFNEENLMQVGEIRYTPGFDLGIDIMFAQGPRAYDYDTETARRLLLDIYKKIVVSADEKGYKRVLCPSMGTGSYGFTHEDTASSVVSILNETLKNRDLELTLVIYDERDLKYYNY